MDSYKSTTKKSNCPIKNKLAKNLSRNFSREDIQMANKHMKRCSTSLNHQKNANQNQMRYHSRLIRKAVIKNKQKITSVCRDMEKLEPLCTVVGTVKWSSCCRKQYCGSSKILKIEIPQDLATLLLGIYPKELKAGSQRGICTFVFIAAHNTSG